jgi:hypothetical protein
VHRSVLFHSYATRCYVSWHTRSSQPVTVTISRCLVAAFRFSGIANCFRSQVPASHSNNSQPVNLSGFLTGSQRQSCVTIDGQSPLCQARIWGQSQIFLTVKNLRVFYVRRPVSREDGSVIYNLSFECGVSTSSLLAYPVSLWINIATFWWLNDPDIWVRFPAGKTNLSLNWVMSSPSFLPNRHLGGGLPLGKSCRSLKLSIHLLLRPIPGTSIHLPRRRYAEFCTRSSWHLSTNFGTSWN